MRALSFAALLASASAFVAPSATRMSRGRSVQMQFDAGSEAGAVTWFPASPSYWDPLKFSTTEERFNQFRAAEVKHGRVAMLACLDYFTHWFGIHLPGNLGPVPISEIPDGLAAIEKVPNLGWAQIIAFASLLEILAPQKPDKVPGNVQPDTELFPVPGDVAMQTREINNGRLALIGITGIWAGEALTGGQAPLDTFKDWLASLG